MREMRQKIGKMRERVKLQALRLLPVDVAGGSAGGDVAEDWQDVAEIWAKVEQMNSDAEALTEDVAVGNDLYLVTIRHFEGLKISYRLLWREKGLEIMSIRQVGGYGRIMQLICSDTI